MQSQNDVKTETLAAERRVIEKDQRKAESELRELPPKIARDTTGLVTQRLAEVQMQTLQRQARLDQVRAQEADLAKQKIPDTTVAQALAQFDEVWESLTPKEQARMVSLLVEGVDYDGTESTVSIRFHPAGIRSLAQSHFETAEAV